MNHFTDIGRVLVCGDFNARVGNSKRHDYIVNDRIVDGIYNNDYIPDIPLYAFQWIMEQIHMV